MAPRDLHGVVGAARIHHQDLVGEADAREARADLAGGVVRDDGNGEGKLVVGGSRHGELMRLLKADILQCHPMPAPRVLFVKLSSLGDVIHHLPAVSDLATHRPDAHIAWAVEEAYAELVRLHPGVSEVIPVGLRGLRRGPLERTRWGRLAEARRTLARGGWDYVIDSQGLVKSALVARAARGVSFGMDRGSARERLAARFYDVKLPVARDRHAVDRNRDLVGQVFGYRPDSQARYGLLAPASPPSWAPAQPYAVLLHAASRADKGWADDRWTALGAELSRSEERRVGKECR